MHSLKASLLWFDSKNFDKIMDYAYIGLVPLGQCTGLTTITIEKKMFTCSSNE